MEHVKKMPLYPIAATAALLLGALACSVDLGLESKPDETEMALSVEGTIAAAHATDDAYETQTAQAVPTDTPAPTFTNTLPPTDTPIPTDTIIPTETLTPTPEGVSVTPIEFAAKVDEDGNAVNPSGQFKKGTTTLYAVFTYSGIRKGDDVVFRWDNNGKEFSTIRRTWSHDESGGFWVNVYWVEGGRAAQRKLDAFDLCGRRACPVRHLRDLLETDFFLQPFFEDRAQQQPTDQQRQPLDRYGCHFE